MVARLVHSREWSPIAGLRGGADHASGHYANRHVGAIRRGNWRADKANLPSSGHPAARVKQRLRQLSPAVCSTMIVVGSAAAARRLVFRCLTRVDAALA